jgi:hypothetical protein
MAIIKADKVEVNFEKQPAMNECKWLVQIRIEKKLKTKTILLIKTNNIPYVLFNENIRNMIVVSRKIKLTISKKRTKIKK